MSTIEQQDAIKYYCFNKNCNNSIYNLETTVVVELPLSKAFGEDNYCQECFEELISKETLDFKTQLNSLLYAEQSISSIIIDDDPVYHRIFKQLFKNSSVFKQISHYKDGKTALNYLTENKHKAHIIPDMIFLDINMPVMDAWDFLDEFENIYPTMSKKTEVYVISSDILPAYKERLKSYKYVKALIDKPFDKSSLKRFLVEFDN